MNLTKTQSPIDDKGTFTRDLSDNELALMPSTTWPRLYMTTSPALSSKFKHWGKLSLQMASSTNWDSPVVQPLKCKADCREELGPDQPSLKENSLRFRYPLGWTEDSCEYE